MNKEEQKKEIEEITKEKKELDILNMLDLVKENLR